MKRLLLIVLMLMLVVVPAMGTTSPIKTNFQDYAAGTTCPTPQGDWIICSGSNVKSPDSTGKIYLGMWGDTPGTMNAVATPYTYAAATYTGAKKFHFSLYDISKNDIYSYSTATSGRIEFIIQSGVAKVYNNGVLVATSGVLTANPQYFHFGTPYPEQSIDDIIVGYEEDSTIIGTPPSNWFILYDILSPASTGLYQTNATLGGSPILKNSNYFGVSYGRGTSTATTLQLIDPVGTVVHSYPVANMSCQCTLPISDLMVGGSIRNGLWRVSLADSATSGYLWVIGSGASGAWSQESYTQGDTATFSYTILDSSWNTGTSTYRFDTFDVYGNVVDTQTISTQTGAKTVSLDSTDYPSGVYYGAVIQTTGGEDTWLAADAMEVSAYIKYVGGIYDAESEAQITSNVAVNITQGGITDTTYTTTGVYNSTDGLAFGTGSLTTFTVSASGYQTSVTSFTPMIAKTITKNITLIRSSPTCSAGICLGGLANETIYSSPVANVTIAVTNATYGESYTTSTNSVGWYNLGESDGVFFTNGRCYHVTASKTGYTGNTYLKCVVGT